MLRISLLVMVALIWLPLLAQSVKHLNVENDGQGRYVLEFDVKGTKAAPDAQYKVIIKAKNDDLEVQPSTATGAGIYHPIVPGKCYRIIWSPATENLPIEGWGFNLKLEDTNPQSLISQQKKDHPLVITASYLLIFTSLYLINLLNQ